LELHACGKTAFRFLLYSPFRIPNSAFFPNRLYWGKMYSISTAGYSEQAAMTQNNLRIRQALVQQLESLERAGVMQLAKAKPRAKRAKPAVEAKVSKPVAATPPAAAKQPAAQAPVQIAVEAPKKNAAAPVATPAGTLKLATPQTGSGAARPKDAQAKAAVVQELQIVQAEVAGCTQCKELARTRTQTVFGVGNPQPRLCFLGEAPGADEDQQGEPFVGKAGQLLNKIMEACHIKREDVYILNILKCRPPGNRLPLPAEACNCRGFLDRQLALLQPEFIVCLGACAAQNLLQTEVAIGKLRGKFYEHQNARVLCTYHPAYLLRNPDAKKFVWEDMKQLMREMGTPID
jgi:uracil-DNA glycosylase